MQYLGCLPQVTFLCVAANDNDDLLSFAIPAFDLSLIRNIKHELREENAATGMLLRSPRVRRFFQEVLDAERYLMLRYFTSHVPEDTIRALKRHILNTYLFPKKKRRRKKTATAPKTPNA